MGADPVVLVTGAGGQVGLALREHLPGARFLSRAELDVCDAAQVRRALSGADVVVHLAALTDVDRCERDPALAHAVNAEGTRHVVEAVPDTARVIYVSTDYVFDGCSERAYEEGDAVGPINVYGRSKLAGEGFVAGLPRSLIVRTSWVFGEGRNFVRSIVAAARAGRALRVVDDQRGRPTAAADLARALAHLVAVPRSGVLHVSGDGPPATWADVADRAVRSAGLDVGVARIDTAAYVRDASGTIAPRPANSTLSIERARAAGVPLADWRRSLDLYVAALA
jgi:dTDP-4-dehydrorhamnose reductase